MTPPFDVVIPSYQENILGLTHAIAEYQPESRITIVDNGNRDLDLWRPNLRVVPLEENLGFVKASNIGIAMSTASHVVLQNDDTHIFTSVYDSMRKFFDYKAGEQWHISDKRPVGIVGCVSSPGFSWVAYSNRRECYPEYANITKDTILSPQDHARIAAEMAEKHKGEFIEAGMIPFFCVMISRDVINKVGYLSEDYGIGLGDDDQYCERVRRAGFKILLALDTYVFHKQRTTFKTLYTEQEIKSMQNKNILKFEEWKKQDNT